MITKFSQKFVDDLQCSQDRISYNDSNCKFLTIRTSKTSISYYYVRKINNAIKGFKIGSVKEISYKQACLKVAQISLDIANGSINKPKAQNTTLQQLFDNFMQFKNMRGDAKTNIKDSISRFNRLVYPSLKNLKFHEVKTIELEKLILNIGSTTGKRTANLLLMDINSAYNYQIKLDPDCTKNPAKNVTKFENNQRSRFLTEAEFKIFFRELEKMPSLLPCLVNVLAITKALDRLYTFIMHIIIQIFDLSNSYFIKKAILIY